MSDQTDIQEVQQPHRIIDEDLSTTARERENNEAASEFNDAQHGQLSMEVKVYSPFKSYYEGDAFSVSAVNLTGPFDILPKHHNFISLLSACDLIIRTTDKGERKIQISGGIIHVKADKLIVFLDV